MRPPQQAEAALDRFRRRQRPVLADVRQTGRDRRRGQLHLPPRLREMGAKTVYWEMNLRQRVGTPTAPLRPELVDDWADRIFYRAVASTNCARPWMALNEMWGANLPTPWSQTNAQYRANVLSFVRRLSALGARPYLLLSTRPFTDGEAADWWRETALYTTFVRETYVPAPAFHRQGPVLASRNLRRVFRSGITELTEIGVPIQKTGLILGFHTNPRHRRPRRAQAGECVVQPHQAPGPRRQAGLARTALPDDLVVGLGRVGPERSRPRQAGRRLRLALDAQPHALQRPGRGRPRVRQIADRRPAPVPAGRPVQDTVGNVSSRAVAAAAHVTEDREVALSSLFAHVVLTAQMPVTSKELRAAQRTVIASRFGGSTAAYRRALKKVGATRELARSIISDQIRQVRIARRFAVPRASARDRRLSPLGLREARAARRGHTGGPVARTTAARRRDRGQRARSGLRHSGRPHGRDRDRHRHVQGSRTGPNRSARHVPPGSGPLGHRRHAHEVGPRPALRPLADEQADQRPLLHDLSRRPAPRRRDAGADRQPAVPGAPRLGKDALAARPDVDPRAGLELELVDLVPRDLRPADRCRRQLDLDPGPRTRGARSARRIASPPSRSARG